DRISAIPWAQRQPGYVRMGIDESWHQRVASDVNYLGLIVVQARLRHRDNAAALNQYLERLLQFRESVEHKIRVHEKSLTWRFHLRARLQLATVYDVRKSRQPAVEKSRKPKAWIFSEKGARSWASARCIFTWARLPIARQRYNVPYERSLTTSKPTLLTLSYSS